MYKYTIIYTCKEKFKYEKKISRIFYVTQSKFRLVNSKFFKFKLAFKSVK